MMRHRSRGLASRLAAMLIAACVFSWSWPGVVSAQGVMSPWTPRLQLDNDAYNFWKWHTKRPDEEYTNGVFASLDGWQAPRWARAFTRGVADCTDARPGNRCHAGQLSIAQELYTPNLRRAPGLIAEWQRERPYFAWLFLRTTSLQLAPDARRSLSAALGVTGSPAMGSVAQTIAHRFGVTAAPAGWDTQIGFEPGVLLEGRQSWRRGLIGTAHDPLSLSWLPEVGASVGTIRAHADAAVTVRLDSRRMHPWYPLGTHTPRMGWWVAARLRGAITARDMSLDGTLRSPSRRVERVPGFFEYALSGGVQLGRLALGYSAHTRSREYHTGPNQRSYSSMSVSWMPHH